MVSKTTHRRIHPKRTVSKPKTKQTQKRAPARKHTYRLICKDFVFGSGWDYNSSETLDTGVKIVSSKVPTQAEMDNVIVKYIIDEHYPYEYHLGNDGDLYFSFYDEKGNEYEGGRWLTDVLDALRKHHYIH